MSASAAALAGRAELGAGIPARAAGEGAEPPPLTEAANPDNRRSPMSPARQARSCVIVVENLPVPFDRRVWQEAQARHRAGWTVSVICPTNADFPNAFEIIDGIAIYRHPLPPEGRGALAYFR